MAAVCGPTVAAVKPQKENHMEFVICKLKICFAYVSSLDFCLNPERQGSWGVRCPFPRREDGAQVT